MTIYEMFVAFLITHWVADFLLQTRWMANNKSSRLDALGLHVLVYTTGIGLVAFWLFGLGAWTFVVVNGVAHFITDFFTSKITKILWRRKMEWEFFAVVGWDQLAHQLTLAFTIQYFYGAAQ